MSNRPVTLIVAAVILAVEGAVALVLGGYVAVETLVGAPADVTSSVFVGIFGIVAGAALLWVARGALRAARWSRAPGVVTQIFALPVAVSLVQSGQVVIGVLLALAALAGLAVLLAPATTRAMIEQ
ncbi:hypothetical protein Sme01_71540 [Sphaerisporangium melleum]|uniref:Integral membrane protein n=1 Tax=Sphaerisporangium melleum TaxID=321316 RepID=A0A917RP77_9ACTN|nr:hypothetical protein [Sphaerisporangium melleum]GGL17047.1 hypothetical protein GCM10007964_68790 [Sphaerisporangium melleum]GII74678.1 hypothetical protein Sme01_71540 [Sphaerisporangium melleum]